MIKILDLATQEVTTAFGPQAEILLSLDWAPTQDVMAFRTGGSVFTMALPDGTPQFLAEGDCPSWSPDDSQLVYTSSLRGREGGVRSLDLATGESTRIADSGGDLDWSRAP